MFYEPPGATHEVSKNASQTQPAKLLALIFAPKGATLTMPARLGTRRRRVDGRVAVELRPGEPVLGLEHDRFELRAFQRTRDACAVRVPPRSRFLVHQR